MGMRGGMLLVLSLALGCASEPGPQGPPGAPGADAPLAASRGAATSCTTGDRFCDGTTIWRCTRSGLDAEREIDCAAQSRPANPGLCTTDASRCFATAPCCTSTLPQCVWSFFQPDATAGETFTSNASGTESCLPGRAGRPAPLPSGYQAASSCPGSPTLSYAWTKAYDGCPRSYRSLSLAIDRVAVRLGTITLAAAGVPGVTLTLQRSVQQTSGGFYAAEAAGSCSSWTGTIAWISDLPSWRVTINATCAETGKETLKVIGTMSGDEP